MQSNLTWYINILTFLFKPNLTWHQAVFFKKLTEDDVDPSWSINVEWIIKNPLFYGFLALFLLEAVEAMDVTFNQIQGS